MKVVIVGAGYVGLTLGIALAEKEHEVAFVERDEERRKYINERKAFFFECGIDERFKLAFEGSVPICFRNFEDLSSASQDSRSPVIWIITLGTPLLPIINTPDFGPIQSVYAEILAHCDLMRDVVILRSTVAIGTTNRIWNLNEQFKNLAFCPERTLEGNALQELATLPTIFAATSPIARELTINLFSSLNPDVIEVSSLETAEAVKLVCNAYRDYSFAFANLLSEVCMKWNIDFSEMKHAAVEGYGRSSLAQPGPVGGPCLEKDTHILQAALSPSTSSFMVGAREYNNSYTLRMIHHWIADKNLQPSSRILIAGAAFKGRPPTSDLRGSHVFAVVGYLLSSGVSCDAITVFDPHCDDSVKGVPIIKLFERLQPNFDFAVILNDTDFFATEPFFNLLVRSNAQVLSFWQFPWMKNRSPGARWHCVAGYHIR